VDVTGKATGRWDVVVTRGGCLARTSDYADYLVVVGTFANGEFELPPEADPNTPCDGLILGIPQSWSASTGQGSMDRDHTIWQPATCPSPAGGHYGSLTSGYPTALYAYQTVRVTSGQQYTAQGVFAGAGMNGVYLELYDGPDYTDPVSLISTTTVREHTGSLDPAEVYDWTQGTVTGTAVSNVMTVVWRMDVWQVEVNGASASHADGLSFGIPCAGTPPTITPPLAPNSGNQGQILDNVAINGSDFVVGNTTVQLTKAGQPTITASDVQVAVGGASLTCDLDLTGAADGAWNVVVTTNPGCTATLLGGFTVNIPPPCNTPPQDTDGDHDVDLTDFGVFQTCFNGPNRSYGGPGTIADKCKCLDVDPDDLDVDLTDFGKFQSCFNGPNRPAQGSCT
jgi:hypothetical protein